MAANQTGSRTGTRRAAAPASPDPASPDVDLNQRPSRFNERLTPEAREAIREITVWRTTTPDSPFGTHPAEVGDDHPYVPPALIPDGLDDLTESEIRALYGADGPPAGVPDEVSARLSELSNQLTELNSQVSDLEKRVAELEHKGGSSAPPEKKSAAKSGAGTPPSLPAKP